MPSVDQGSGLQNIDFGTLLKTGMDQVVATQKASEVQSAKAIAGTAEITDVVAAVTQAELTLETVLAVRDKLVSSYQELMRIQV